MLSANQHANFIGKGMYGSYEKKKKKTWLHVNILSASDSVC